MNISQRNMNDSVFFTKSIPTNFSIAYGQLYDIGWVCYIRGKQLGYKNVCVEWQNKNAFLWNDMGFCIAGMLKPNNTVLPINYIEEGNEFENCDKILMNDSNIFWDGSPPLIENKSTHIGLIIYIYLNLYKYTTGKYPFIPVDDRNTGNYVVIHYRHSNKSNQQHRNIDSSKYIELIRYLREYHKEVKIVKIGEISPFDSIVDVVLPYFLFDQDKLYRIIASSKMFIGSDCGPQCISKSVGNPSLILCPDYKKATINWKKRKQDYGFEYLSDDPFSFEDKSIQVNLDIEEPDVMDVAKGFIDKILC